MTTEAHTEISKRLETMPSDQSAIGTLISPPHKHYDWCIFADAGDNVSDCLNSATGVAECEGRQLTVPLTIEGPTSITVMPTVSHDVTGPYLWLGQLEPSAENGDVWLTPTQAVTLGHYLIATAALITEL